MNAITYRSPTEDELTTALDRLEALLVQARENFVLQGRDAGAVHVLLEHWREDLAARRIRPRRFMWIVDVLVSRDLVHLDGPFASLVGWRPGVHSSSSTRTHGAPA